MRTLIDLTEQQVQALDDIAKAEKLSHERSSAPRSTPMSYVTVVPKNDNAFGLWGERGTDGLEYQEKVRSEW
ncbi:MAG: CopG family transcriptional regulator [Pararhizobium sp.]